MAATSGHAADFALRRVRKAAMNYQSMEAFAGAIGLVAVLCISFHLARRAGRTSWRQPHLAAVSRKMRSLFLRKAPWLPSAGHGVIVSIYALINLVLLFTNMDNKTMSQMTNIASRAAWLAMGNLLLVVFLALKNTPLAFLTAWSYERLNILHQVAGYSTVVYIIIHASLYTAYFVGGGRSSKMLEVEEIYGMVAGLSLVILAFAGAVVRRWWYELFYYIHITFWMVAIVMICLHQPSVGKKIVFLACAAAGMWVLDRLIRLARLVFYSANNTVTLTPLSNGGTRLTLKKPPVGAVSGKHCFLWIPKIRSAETHPFTIAAMGPLEFVVASYDGFTGDLHRYAMSHPGVALKASVEGSYGTFPQPAEYDTVVLVAGGSGSSFTFGMALNMLKAIREDDKKKIVFIWAVKHYTYFDWYSSHLSTLRNDARVDVQLYVTRSPPLQVIGASPETVAEAKAKRSSLVITSKVDPEKAINDPMQPNNSSVSIDSEKPRHSESGGSTTGDEFEHPLQFQGIPVTYERPDVGALIRSVVSQTPKDQRALVMGCGPDGLMTQVRNTTAACIQAEGPAVELHCEQFGW